MVFCDMLCCGVFGVTLCVVVDVVRCGVVIRQFGVAKCRLVCGAVWP